MTDDDARQRIAGLLPDCSRDPHLDAALRHALQAIEDRAALVECDGTVYSRERRAETFVAARRHMRGED